MQVTHGLPHHPRRRLLNPDALGRWMGLLPFTSNLGPFVRLPSGLTPTNCNTVSTSKGASCSSNRSNRRERFLFIMTAASQGWILPLHAPAQTHARRYPRFRLLWLYGPRCCPPLVPSWMPAYPGPPSLSSAL